MPPTESAPASPPPAAPAASKASVFARRLVSTLGLWAVVIAAVVFAKGAPFFLILGVLSFIGIREWVKMDPTLPRPWALGLTALTVAWFVVTFAICGATGAPWHPLLDLAFIAGAAFLAFLPTLFRPLEGRATLWAIVYSVMGFLYVPWLGGFMTRVLYFPGVAEDGRLPGVPYLVFMIAATKFTDAGAYAVGSLIGKHKMIPHLSPGKTWEGMIGAVLGAMGAGFAVYYGFGPASMPLLSPLSVALTSLALAAVCVVADLAESVVKRCLGVKDSGTMLPGIGGALDLLDSLLFTGPVFFFYLWYVSR